MGANSIRQRIIAMIWSLALGLSIGPTVGKSDAREKNPEWTAPHRFRMVLVVDPRGQVRSHSPASVELNSQSPLGAGQVFDEHSVEVVTLDGAGRPRVFDPSRPESERSLVPHRIDRLFGSDKATLHFVVPDHTCTKFAVYFDTIGSGLGRASRDHGLIGDGDKFREEFQRREIAASHFDQFVDFDGDGDCDLLQGGLEPFVNCYENVGGNRLVPRGRLASGGELFRLPCSKQNRSWLTVAFFDVDGDGDQDFIPSFNDGPDAGRIVLYRNTTTRGKPLTFSRVGPLHTKNGEPLAGGAQAGGWFPSITFVTDWDGDKTGRLDALVGSNQHCWLYRGLGTHADGSPQFAEAVAVQAGGMDIQLTNPRFDTADIDADGDLDLFAGAQPGPVWWFENTGTRTTPVLAAGRVVAFEGKYLIGDAHSGVKVADFDGDGLLDIVAGRFWERTDLNHPDHPREFGGFFRNVGSRSAPRFVRDTHGPFTEQFQICDAVRQNCVRAVDWDHDGVLDLLAGDTDGFLWFFRNQSSQRFPIFARGEKIQADGRPLSLASGGGHARFDVMDWDADGRQDLLIADGRGTLSFFRNEGSKSKSSPKLRQQQQVLADGKPVQGGARASVLVCDWDQDGRRDIVFADEKGYHWYRNVGTEASPNLAAPKPILFGGRAVSYVRPNLGSFVDWDGDGKRDFIGCHFENSIRLYRNLGSGTPGSEPQFSDPEGIVLLTASSPQMISGADAVDWNGDGDVDLLTGQGHGGSGLRFFERDWIEDELHGTHPLVTSSGLETKPKLER